MCIRDSLQPLRHRPEILVGLGDVRTLGADIAIMEGVEVEPELGDEVEDHLGPGQRLRERVAAVLPRAIDGAWSEHVLGNAPEAVSYTHLFTGPIARNQD